ncbi:MAG: hypothetical protein PHS99_00465 [Candidatus Marinimicrobia bacterium]|nr:hypothetical protein [Candidatus Neomarinimicrobiota bacterium]
MTKSRKYNDDLIARGISLIFNPLWFSLLFIIYLVAAMHYDRRDTIGIILVGSLSSFVLPVLIIRYMIKKGKTSHMDIPERSQRIVPYIIFSIVYLISFFISLKIGLPPVFIAMLGAICINTVIYGIITLRWKISVHCAGIAGYLSATTFIFGHQHDFLWLFVPFLCWSRVRLKAHTPMQTILGALLGGGFTWIELWLADYWFNIL